ncbi:branched-chain amino acid ABC transporter ATP-binding protein/permease [Reyranella sp.]|uniref:branched-chain amino acid ABC transporter ATP-binding protein/permease n=1 Tax=Reyranella sp. TaxID=1929291 RepID=UPI0040356768
MVVEALTALGLILAPYVLPYLGFSPNTVNQILIWGMFGIGFDILFGYTGLLSFGQSAFYGTGGFIAAYLLTRSGMTSVPLALLIGTIGATLVGLLIGIIALRRTGIYFAMITVAIAEMFFFIENSPMSEWTGGENGLPGVPSPAFELFGLSWKVGTGWSMYGFLAACYFVGIVVALRIVRSPVGAILSAIRDNPLRVAALGHSVALYKLTAFVIASAYAGFAGGLLGVLQGFMPPDAFTFETSGQLVMQTVIGGVGTLFGPLLGAAVWLFLSDFLQQTMGLGATWKLVLGVVFVLLVVFLRHGLIGGFKDLLHLVGYKDLAEVEAEQAEPEGPRRVGAAKATPMPARHRKRDDFTGPILQASGLTKRYGGLLANSDIEFTVKPGELRGIIGPNGAGKSTFFKMLTCEVPPTSGTITFEGQDITGKGVTDACQLGLTKSYQVNQLFSRLTVRQNLTIAALAELRGKFRLDLFRNPDSIPGLHERVDHTLDLVDLTARADTIVSALAYGEKRRLEIGLALATSPRLLLLDEPLAGMSPRERVETVSLLKSISRGRTMIVIDHDMDALFELAEWITVLQEGRVLAEGTPDEIKGNVRVREAYLGGVLDG